MKQQMNVRISDVTRKQISEMKEYLKMTEGEVVAASVERYYAEEMPQGTIIRPVREFGGETWANDNVGEILGLESHAVEDANDWLSDADGDGRMYPLQLRIYKDMSPVRHPWYVVDETGWDGFEKTTPQVISRHATYEAAERQRKRWLKAMGKP